MIQPDIGQVFRKAHAIIPFKKPGKIAIGEIQLVRQLFQADRLVIICPDIVVDLLDPLLKFFLIIQAFLI